MPWAGCSILVADAGTLHALRAKAAAKDDVLIVGMPEPAQTSRAYDEYLDRPAGTANEDLAYRAISLVGPRNKIDRLVGKLSLLR
ncbi:DUF2000 domain-containing protein [Streptomyces sp. NPDC102274]|uniref:DUF2000 domain-containing protein n=1 Tax=Streptomyces sp. NPDC102274 TaxID=3366151 RepID=UPI0038177129